MTTRPRTYFLAAGVTALLAGCGPSEDAGAPVETAPEEARPILNLGAADYYPAIGGEVRALAALPQPTPWRSRILAALATPGGGALAALDLAAGDVALLPFPRVGALVTAPEFELRGSPAPLILAAGGALEGVRVSLYIDAQPNLDSVLGVDGTDAPAAGGGATLAPVPTEPIAPDLDIQRICALRATNALVEFIVVDPDYAEVWRLRDVGGDALAAEKVRDAAEAAGSTACAPRSGGRAVTLDAEGRLGESGPALLSLAVAPLNDGFGGEAVLGARTGVGSGASGEARLVAADPDTGDVLALARVQAQLNTETVIAPSVLAASEANFGGSYGQGVVVVAEGATVSVVGLDTVIEALASRP